MRGAMLSRPAFDLHNAQPNDQDRNVEEEVRVETVFTAEEGTPLRSAEDEKDLTEGEDLSPALIPELTPGATTVNRRVDVNVYSHKKTLAQGMMDLALLSANANQLRYVLDMGRNHPYYYPSVVLIASSLFLQVAVGIGLILNSQYNIKKEHHMHRANRINNFTMIGIFLVTIINVFISAFSISTSADEPVSSGPYRVLANETQETATL
ncbi:ninjurin-A-like [Neocloeon triangulifer]|uniref:ninjurin-A-like n=1 Tax=Neocloeon triangulifer TaxID=2078957 RepID=UPI00286F5778|nr:ninjurin-A-like [Neocloeon triangulifer]